MQIFFLLELEIWYTDGWGGHYFHTCEKIRIFDRKFLNKFNFSVFFQNFEITENGTVDYERIPGGHRDYHFPL